MAYVGPSFETQIIDYLRGNPGVASVGGKLIGRGRVRLWQSRSNMRWYWAPCPIGCENGYGSWKHAWRDMWVWMAVAPMRARVCASDFYDGSRGARNPQ